MNVKAALLRKFGPLPAWAWGGVLAAALVVYRRFKGGSASSGTIAGGAGTGGADQPIGPFLGTGDTGGAGGSDSGLQPTDQQPFDTPGPGTPVVFDPTTGAYTTDPGPADIPAGGLPGEVPHSTPPTTKDSLLAALGLHPGSPTTSQTPPKAPPKTAPKKSPKQQTRKAPELVSEHGAGQGTRPSSARGQTAPKPKKRTQQAHQPAAHTSSHRSAPVRTPPAPTRVHAPAQTTATRLQPTSQPNTGARTSGLVTAARQAAPPPPPPPPTPAPKSLPRHYSAE